MKVHFWKLIVGLALCFFMPWSLLVMRPYLAEARDQPVPYAPADEVEGLSAYPDRVTLRFGESDYGSKVYAAEGCAYCHTQTVRPSYAGPDMYRVNWGGREDKGLARETRPEDFTGEDFAFLGYQRLGQDLANLGHRITKREDMHRHLYDPKSFDPDSGMPAYRHLYRKSESGKMVPTERADALVDYLLSRKKDAKIPAGQTKG